MIYPQGQDISHTPILISKAEELAGSMFYQTNYYNSSSALADIPISILIDTSQKQCVLYVAITGG